MKNALASLDIHPALSVGQIRWQTGAMGFLLIASLVLSNCGGESKAEKEKAAAAAATPIPVIVTPVIQKTVPIFSEFTAQADARDTVELRARVEAFLEGIHFEEGRPVKKGQLLFTLDKRKYQA